MTTNDRHTQTVAFQLDMVVFNELWKAANEEGVSTDEILRQLINRWLRAREDAKAAFALQNSVPQAGTSVSQLEDLELAHIKKVLDDCGGNKTKAAQVLGISTRTLYRRLESIS